MRSDGYANTLSGLGIPNPGAGGLGPQSGNVFIKPCALRAPELRALYDGNWVARRIVDTFPEQALRRPTIVEPGGFDNFDKVNNSSRYPNGAFKHALKMGRLFGGAVIVIGSVNSGAGLAEPLPAGKQDISFLEVVGKYDLASRERYDANDPDPLLRGRTRVFEVMQGRLRGLRIHVSRMIFCEGDTQARFLYDQTDIDFPWQSCLEVVNDVMGAYGISWTAVGHLIQESSMAWLKLRGLADMLTTEDKTVVDARMQLLSVGRQVARTIFLDAGDADSNGEEFGRTAVSFAELPALLQEFTHTIAGASGIPESVLMKQSPSGMNATGEMDIRQFYDAVGEYRQNSVKPKFDQLLEVTGSVTMYTFPSLWEPTDAQAADIRVKNTGADQVLYMINAVTAAQILKSRVKDGTLGITIEDLDVAVAALEAKEKKDAELADAERIANATPPPAKDPSKQATATGGPDAATVSARPGANNISPNS